MPPSETSGSISLLEVDDLRTYFHTRAGVAKAVDGVSFDLAAAETLGLVGESGCGKSVTALSIMPLVSDPPGKIESGAIRMNGRDLLDLSDDEMCAVRGNDVAMIFQEPNKKRRSQNTARIITTTRPQPFLPGRLCWSPSSTALKSSSRPTPIIKAIGRHD